MITDSWKVSWRVVVDGVDVTRRMRPYLIDISVSDQDGEASDACQLTLDDAGGVLKLPRTRRKVEVWVEGALLFSGLVDSVRSSGNRSGGREIRVTAKSMDAEGKVKEPQRLFRDDATLETFLSAAAGHAGLSGITVDPALGGITRDYWAADGESFLQLGQRLARELGATFKIRGDQAVFVPRGRATSLATVNAVVGQNVISWSIAPLLGRPRHRASKARFFDRPAGQHRTVVLGMDETADADTQARATVFDQGQADDVNASRASKARSEGGEGTIDMDLTLAAQAEAPLVMTGARAGVDGRYIIASATHKASRSGGSTTSVQVKQPEDGAGEDDR